VASPSSKPVMADDWRTEYWHDVSVQVPADWEWGAGPIDKRLARCGGPNDPSTPYVGRPIMSSDVCVIQKPPSPTAPYVWLDAPVEPGTVDLPNGYEQDTVEVDGTTVTVGSDDRELRKRILASVASQRLCPSTIDPADPDLVHMPIDGTGELESFDLCAYSADSGGAYELVYGRELSARSYQAFRDASDGAPERSGRCPQPGDRVVLRATSDDLYGDESVTRTWVANVSCGVLTSTTGQVRLTERAVDTWADQGVRSTLRAFIGYLG
jgi:hypothetical protein